LAHENIVYAECGETEVLLDLSPEVLALLAVVADVELVEAHTLAIVLEAKVKHGLVCVCDEETSHVGLVLGLLLVDLLLAQAAGEGLAPDRVEGFLERHIDHDVHEAVGGHLTEVHLQVGGGRLDQRGEEAGPVGVAHDVGLGLEHVHRDEDVPEGFSCEELSADLLGDHLHTVLLLADEGVVEELEVAVVLPVELFSELLLCVWEAL